MSFAAGATITVVSSFEKPLHPFWRISQFSYVPWQINQLRRYINCVGTSFAAIRSIVAVHHLRRFGE
jgi:hypothetical protein